MNSKGQAWTMDIFFGVLIFTISFAILMRSDVNLKSSEDIILENMGSDGNHITDLLLSPGAPRHWNSTNVIYPGILSDGRIDSVKLEELSIMGYGKMKSLYRSRYDFIFSIQNTSDIVPIGGREYFGKPGVGAENLSDQKPKTVLKIMRLAVYNDEIVRLEVLLWQ